MELLKRVEELVNETEKEVRELHCHSLQGTTQHSQQLDWHMHRVQALNQLSKDIQALTQAIYLTSGCNIKEDLLYTINEEIKR